MGGESKKLLSRHSATHRSCYHAVMDPFMSHNAQSVSAINGVGQTVKPATQVAILIRYASQPDCVKRNSRHNLRPASTVRCRSFSANNLQECLAKLRGAILGHRLCCLCSDHTFNPLGVNWFTQGAALLMQVGQIHEAELLTEPCPEHLNRIEVRTLGRHIPQGNVLESVSIH